MDPQIKLLKKYARILHPKLVDRARFSDLKFTCLEDCADCCNGHLVIVPEPELQEMILRETYPISLKPRLRAIRRDRNGYCVFLEEGRCSIQETKPLACKGYPFFLDPFTERVYLDIKCKGLGQGEILSPEKETEMINYRRLYWNFMKLSDEEKRMISEILIIPNITHKFP